MYVTYLINVYFSENAKITFGETPFTTQDLLKVLAKQKASETQRESVFYVPAQRIVSISDGRPKNFMEFDTSTPYVLRRFSETLRIFMQGGLGNPDTIFPMRSRLKGGIKNVINANIFHDAKVVIDKSGDQRRMKLEIGNLRIPFMAWSAGQKEFMPLLLAIYCLSGPPTQVVNKSDYQWVIIEEPEIGLHPSAILSVLLEVIELMQNGYRIVISTHAATFLDFVWTFNAICLQSEETFKEAMCEMFNIKVNTTTSKLFDGLQNKTIKTFYSAQQRSGEGVTFTDISTLDAFSEDEAISEWGGLSSFATKFEKRYTDAFHSH